MIRLVYPAENYRMCKNCFKKYVISCKRMHGDVSLCLEFSFEHLDSSILQNYQSSNNQF